MTMLSVIKLLTVVFEGEPYPSGFVNPFGDSLFIALRTILTFAAMLALVYCGSQVILSTDERIVSRARVWFMAILITVILAYALPTIVENIAGMGL